VCGCNVRCSEGLGARGGLFVSYCVGVYGRWVGGRPREIAQGLGEERMGAVFCLVACVVGSCFAVKVCLEG
jgi:uncharacterized membrane protein YeaQ/YmgE (transglycosylase-associated protein family)